VSPNRLNVLCCSYLSISLRQTVSCERTYGTAADKRYTTNLNITNDKKNLFPLRKRKRPISHHICFLQLLTTFLHINPCPNICFVSFLFFGFSFNYYLSVVILWHWSNLMLLFCCWTIFLTYIILEQQKSCELSFKVSNQWQLPEVGQF